MKHNYLLLLLCCFAISFSNAQIVNIPDPVFKDYLLSVFDTNNDNEIQVSEAEASYPEYIEIYSVYYINNELINDFTGLEAFINVSDFYCEIYGNTSIDLSPYQQLSFVGIYGSFIDSVNVNQNIGLEGLAIYNGQLTSIDLSQNMNLWYIALSNNQFTSIDLSQNINLIEIDMSNNQLTDITFPSFPPFTTFYDLNLSNNQFTNLDLTNFSNFGPYETNLSNNKLSNIVFSSNYPGGQSLNISNNLFSTLDLSHTTFLSLKTNDNYHLQHLNIAIDGNVTGGDIISEVYANNCPNLSVICVVNSEYWPQENLHADQSPNIIITEDCSSSSDDFNQILGTITLDKDNNGCDINDATMEGVLVQTSNGTDTFSTSSYSNGFYTEAVVEGTYIVSLPSLPSYFTIAPTTQDVTFTGYNNTETLDFCVTSTQTVNDVNVTLIPTSQARPGFDASYKLVYKNVGTTILSGDVTLEIDESLQSFVSANPTEDSSSANNLAFNYSNLEPFESREIEILMNTAIPPIVNGGDILNFTATITPEAGDFTPNDNTYTLTQTVVNSYDPNDKQVLQGSEITSDQTTEYLDYLIRFQNTGTASAINVSVTDVLNDKLDWDTFQMVSTSHPYEVNITNGDFVQFVFDNINLPAEQDNEPASHGYISFKIKPKENVVVGNVITGLANIYFDFNAPIITNTVSTEVVDQTLSIHENNTETSIKLYPNPVKNQFKIELLNDTTINSVEVFDIAGKTLLSFKQSDTYNISKLTSGVYFVKIKTNKGEVNKQIVKQ